MIAHAALTGLKSTTFNFRGAYANIFSSINPSTAENLVANINAVYMQLE